MSRRRYPRFGGDRTLKTLNDDTARPTTCAAGPELPVRLIEVQVSWFRGEDEVYAVCADHLKQARRDLLGFFRAVNERANLDRTAGA